MFDRLKRILVSISASQLYIILSLLLIKTVFQIILLRSGMMWLTADDYSRTVISWDWLQSPRIYSGVWLSPHFWLNGLFIFFFKDLTLSPILVSTLFSCLMLIYFYLLTEKLFDKSVAYLSSLVLCVFPFQVWLSTSAMPEPVFFFFITFTVYYFIIWYTKYNSEDDNKSWLYLIISATGLMLACLFRYEGWFFSITFILLVSYISFKKERFTSAALINLALSLISLLGAAWWLLQNYIDYSDPFFFIKETTKIYEHLNTAGFFQRIVQYPFFIFYIAPLTSLAAIVKIYRVLRNKNGVKTKYDYTFLKIFLLFNFIELVFLMFSGIYGSGGLNMISRYIVMNAVFLFPFAVWQLLELRRYVLIGGIAAMIIVNMIWSFYFQEAYREDTYEVAYLTKKLIQKNYFEKADKIYFEIVEGYYDIYALQVISNSPNMIISDTIPPAFPVTVSSKKIPKKKREEEQQRLNIIELRKFLEAKKIRLFIARSDLLIDKLRKLSYKSEEVGDYRIFYLAENAISPATNINPERKASDFTTEITPKTVSFGKKLVLKEFHIDNLNLGFNPQTVSVKWQLADLGILDSLEVSDDQFGRYRVKVELAPADQDSVVYGSYTSIFSERNTEEFFDTKEIKNILVLKPFALLNYSRRYKLSPFESGLYDLRLSIVDAVSGKELKVYRGDSLFTYSPDGESENDSTQTDFKFKQTNYKKIKEYQSKNPFYPLGRIVALFPNANYNAIMKSSREVAQLIIRNGFLLPFLQRYQGDQMLNVVFNYF